MVRMVNASLQFAHGPSQAGSVSEEVEKKIVGMFPPSDLLMAYQLGRQTYKTNDLVLVAAKEDPEIITPWPRHEYIKSALHRQSPKQLARIRLAQESAHRITKLPVESAAFWFVLEDNQLPAPIMTVLYSVAYEQAAQGVELS